MKTRVEKTSSGRGAFITILETDEEIAERQRRRRAEFEASKQARPLVITVSHSNNTTVSGER